MTDIGAELGHWHVPPPPAPLGQREEGPGAESAGSQARRTLAAARSRIGRTAIEIAISDWVYDLVRANVKRGRFFELSDVLRAGRADCLGYARLFSAVGPLFGVDFGVVEVIVDNSGRHVPHHVGLLNLSNGTRRFVDAWYGSKNVVHRRIGALVDGKPRDVDVAELGDAEVRGLPDACIDAITLYIRSNRLLEQGEFDPAIEGYSRAIRLYPNNTRAYYNRALARDRKGDVSGAEQDYAEALKDESRLVRVLATVEELEGLLLLDERRVPEREQDIYLWRKGFKTGKPTDCEEIARTVGMSTAQVRQIIARTERLLAG
ncbi:MAG: tetratricopeptide repeat protein [Chloroflexota bacterium]|nr:tetratricopeptide repeat protein [Chloroflexota bacterium]